MSRGRSLSVAAPAAGSGLKDAGARNKAVKMADRAQRKMNKMVGGARRDAARRSGRQRVHTRCFSPKSLTNPLLGHTLATPQAKVGEADRVIPTKMPKHLFSGTLRFTWFLAALLPCCLVSAGVFAGVSAGVVACRDGCPPVIFHPFDPLIYQNQVAHHAHTPQLLAGKRGKGKTDRR